MGADFRLDPLLVIMTIEPLTPAAKAWVENNTEPWQRQDDRVCVEHPLAVKILRRIVMDGLSCEDTPIEIPDERGAAERLLQERNWVRVLHRKIPKDMPKRDNAVAMIEQALRQIGFQIQ
jgi:hypothetical protein